MVLFLFWNYLFQEKVWVVAGIDYLISFVALVVLRIVMIATYDWLCSGPRCGCANTF